MNPQMNDYDQLGIRHPDIFVDYNDICIGGHYRWRRHECATV